MNDAIEYIMIDEPALNKRINELAAEISKDYKNNDKRILLVGILKGSAVFMTELMKRLDLPVEIDFMKASSYGSGTISSGTLSITLDLNRKDMKNIDIIIVEDIADSGRTLRCLKDHLEAKGANSVKTCTMLDKPSRREVEFVPDYCGFNIEDEFVVGFGLDYDERYRNLPYIGVLKPSVYGAAQKG